MLEEPLAGGNLNPVLRVGDTVRRVAGPWTPSVHALLGHLAREGFDGAPRVLGYDEQGWDLAAPGPPVWDLAYAARRFVPLYAHPGATWPTDVAHRAERLRLLCDSYGLSERGQLVGTIGRRIACALDTLEAWGQAGVAGWDVMWRARTHADGMRRDLAYLDEHRPAFDRVLA